MNMERLYGYLPILVVFGVILTHNANADTAKANEIITIRPENPTTDQEVIATIKGCNLVNFTITAGQFGQFIAITDDNNFINTNVASCTNNSTVDVPLGKLKVGEYPSAVCITGQTGSHCVCIG
jgi:hypothetical protein